MTLYQIVKTLCDIASENPNINSTGFNDVYALNNKPNIEYSVFFVTQNTHQEDTDVIRYNLNLFYIDRLTDTDDYDYQLKTQSDGILYLTNIINTFNEMVNDCTINRPITFTSFNQKFADECCGVYANVLIEVDNNLGLCDE